MYHDQGLIPVKTLDMWGGVNVTLGLPFIRTSPDHGVAYDAGRRRRREGRQPDRRAQACRPHGDRSRQTRNEHAPENP